MECMPPIPRFLTVTAAAKRTAISREAIVRMLARGLVMPDAYIQYGEEGDFQPLFLEANAVKIMVARARQDFFRNEQAQAAAATEA